MYICVCDIYIYEYFGQSHFVSRQHSNFQSHGETIGISWFHRAPFRINGRHRRAGWRGRGLLLPPGFRICRFPIFPTKILPRSSMVLEYESQHSPQNWLSFVGKYSHGASGICGAHGPGIWKSTKLSDFLRANVRIHVPAPWAPHVVSNMMQDGWPLSKHSVALRQ